MCRTPHSALLALTGSLVLPSLIWTPASVPERCVIVRKGLSFVKGLEGILPSWLGWHGFLLFI